MPAYNEEGCIEKVVREWAAEASRQTSSFEVIVVDDGSSDSTGAILDRLSGEIPQVRVIHQANAGHGVALRRGLEAARAQWIFHVDSDDQFTPEDFVRLWDCRESYDYLAGFRAYRRDALHRRVISRLVRVATLALFGASPRDPNVPFKLIRRAALHELLALVPSGVFAPSIMMSLAASRRFRFVEIPVQHFPRKTGRVSIVRWKLWKACFRCVAELTRFRNVLR
jgi:glycosyltransferase involved in cell wall biosynthesis